MKQFLLSAALAIMAFSGSAQTFDEWRNPRVNEVNRAPMHSSYFAYESFERAEEFTKSNSSKWKMEVFLDKKFRYSSGEFSEA